MAFDAVTYAAARTAARKYTDTSIESVSKGYNYKGTVANASALPLSGNTKGDLYITQNNGHEYVWTIDAASGQLTDWIDKSMDLDTKIANPSEKENNDTLIFNETSNKWESSSLKSVNGQSLLGSGDVEIKTYQAFPTIWQTSGTLEEVVDSILQDETYTKKGMAYLGDIQGECTPFGYGNAECTVSFLLDGVAVLSVSSSNVAPYKWDYNTASYDYVWKKCTDVVANPSAVALEPLTKISIDGELYKIEGKNYSAGQNITINNDIISATDTKYTAGENITIDTNNVINAATASFDEKTVIKGSDNKYQTEIGGWKETTPEQLTNLFINTKADGSPTYIDPDKYEIGWDYSPTITSLVSGATTATVKVKITVLDTIFDNNVLLTKAESIPAYWESADLTIGAYTYKIKVYDNYVGSNQGGFGLIANNHSVDLSHSIMEVGALVTGSSTVIYHPIDNKFVKTDNSLTVNNDNQLKVNTEVIQDKLSAGSNVTINDDNVISAVDTTYTAGTNVTIDSNNVIRSNEKLQSAIVVQNAIGDIKVGETLPVGTSVETIIRRMLLTSAPVVGVAFYWGAIDESVPTLASLDQLNKSIGLNKDTLIANGLEKNIVSNYIPALDEGQVQLVAVSKSLRVSDWKNKATGWSYKGNYTEITLGEFNVYYFNQRVDSEPDGEDMKFEFQEA